MKKIEHYRNQLSKKLEFEIILMFRMAMPAEVGSYVLGSLKYNFGKYLFAIFITELPYVVLTVYLGEAFLKSQFIFFLALLTVLFLITGAMFICFIRK